MLAGLLMLGALGSLVVGPVGLEGDFFALDSGVTCVIALAAVLIAAAFSRRIHYSSYLFAVNCINYSRKKPGLRMKS